MMDQGSVVYRPSCIGSTGEQLPESTVHILGGQIRCRSHRRDLIPAT